MSDGRTSKQPSAVSPDPRSDKRRYERPELVRYGSVAKLTQGTATVGSDGPLGGMMNAACL